MKIEMPRKRWVMTALLLSLAFAPLAQAFYNPSTGRWLSRDPINEFGFNQMLRTHVSFNRDEEKTLYGFVRNNPVLHVDGDGRAIPPVLIGAVALIAAIEACALPQHTAAMNRFPDSGDKFKHCWVSCRISKSCGGVIAELAGLGKEVRDRAVAAYCDTYPGSDLCQGGHGDFWDSIMDLKANQQCIGLESIVGGPFGGWIGALCRRSCEDCCKAKVGYNSGEP